MTLYPKTITIEWAYQIVQDFSRAELADDTPWPLYASYRDWNGAESVGQIIDMDTDADGYHIWLLNGRALDDHDIFTIRTQPLPLRLQLLPGCGCHYRAADGSAWHTFGAYGWLATCAVCGKDIRRGYHQANTDTYICLDHAKTDKAA